jgi:hypothetical protein
VQAQGLARQRQGQHLAQERLAAFHYPQARELSRASYAQILDALIEIRTVALHGIGDDVLLWQQSGFSATSLVGGLAPLVAWLIAITDICCRQAII